MEPLVRILILSSIEVNFIGVGLVNCAMCMKYYRKETNSKEKKRNILSKNLYTFMVPTIVLSRNKYTLCLAKR